MRNTAETTYHPVGTCKMGSDPMAVVDNELRVHGIDGLRVADASIMPTLTSGNTNAPCIMIGEKCAAMVLAPRLAGSAGRRRSGIRDTRRCYAVSSGPASSWSWPEARRSKSCRTAATNCFVRASPPAAVEAYRPSR